MIPTAWSFPVNFALKNYTCTLNFEKKKNFQVRSQNRENDHLGMSDSIFFLVEKKVDHSVFWGEIYRRLP